MPRKNKTNAEATMVSINKLLDEVFSWSNENITLERRSASISEVVFPDGSIVVIKCANREPGKTA